MRLVYAGESTRPGFDDIALAQLCHPALTTAHIPTDQIGETICDCLLNREREPAPHEFVIDPELVLRDSTGSARSSRSSA